MSSGELVGTGTGEDLLCQAVGAGEPHQPFDAAQPGLLGGPFDDRHAVAGNPGEDLVKRAMVVDLPAERGDVLGGSALQQKSALVVVEAESHHVGQGLVQVHADRIAAEPPPLGELFGVDDDIAEMNAAEDVHRVENRRFAEEVNGHLVEQVGSLPLHPMAGARCHDQIGVGHQVDQHRPAGRPVDFVVAAPQHQGRCRPAA